MNISLRGQVVIAFRSNSYCFWEIWAVRGSIPLSGTWFFFFVQINFWVLFMNIQDICTPNQVSKVLGNLSKITLRFWTLWHTYFGTHVLRRRPSFCGSYQKTLDWLLDKANRLQISSTKSPKVRRRKISSKKEKYFAFFQRQI